MKFHNMVDYINNKLKCNCIQNTLDDYTDLNPDCYIVDYFNFNTSIRYVLDLVGNEINTIKPFHFYNNYIQCVKNNIPYIQIFLDEFQSEKKINICKKNINSLMIPFEKQYIWSEDENYIREISKKELIDFHNINSLEEVKIGSINLGLYSKHHKDQLLAVMALGHKQNRYKYLKEFKVLSFCDVADYYMFKRTGFSPLIEYFCNNYKFNSIELELNNRYYNRFFNEHNLFNSNIKFNQITDVHPKFHYYKIWRHYTNKNEIPLLKASDVSVARYTENYINKNFPKDKRNYGYLNNYYGRGNGISARVWDVGHTKYEYVK